LDSVPFAGFLKPADVFQSCQGAHFRASRIVVARFLSFPSGQSEKSSRVTLTRAKARVDRWVVSQEQTSAWAPKLVPPPGRGVCARRLGEAHPRGHSTSPAHESSPRVQPKGPAHESSPRVRPASDSKKRCRRLRAVWSVRDHCRQISVLLPPSGLGRAAWVRKSGLSGCLFGMRVAPGFSGAIAIHFQVI
jgi:hypothetical protein